MSREFLPPPPKSGLPDIKAYPLLTHSLYHHVHMRMRLIGVKYHGIAVLERELLPREILDCFQNLLGRGARWH